MPFFNVLFFSFHCNILLLQFLTDFTVILNKSTVFHLKSTQANETHTSLERECTLVWPTPYRRLISEVVKPSPWLKMAVVDLYGWAHSIDFWLERCIADIPYFLHAG